MNIKGQAVRGLKWQAVELGGVQVLGLVVFTTLTRVLDPSAFGLVGVVTVYLAFVEMFVDQGIGASLIQRKDLQPGHLECAFWFNAFFATLVCGGTIALASPIAIFFDEPMLAPLLKWASLSLVINAAVSVHHTIFSREMDFRRPAIRTLVGKGVGGLVAVVMALYGWGVWSLVGQQLAASFAGAVFLWTASSWRPALKFSFAHLRELMGISVSVFSVSLLWFFSSRLDQIVIGKFLGPPILGQYLVGAKLPELARIVIQRPVAAVSLPALSRLQDDQQRMRHAIYQGMELNALVSFAVFGGLATVAPSLVPLAFGVKWIPAVPMLQLLALYNLTTGLFVYCHPALLATGASGLYLVASTACAFGSAVACTAGIFFGVQALIIGLIVNMAAVGLLALLFLRQRMGLSLWRYCRPCIVPAVAAGLMFVTVYALRHLLFLDQHRFVGLVLEVLAGTGVYIFAILSLAGPSLQRMWNLVIYARAHHPQPI